MSSYVLCYVQPRLKHILKRFMPKGACTKRQNWSTVWFISLYFAEAFLSLYIRCICKNRFARLNTAWRWEVVTYRIN